MNQEQLKKVRDGKGFIAALDQSGGSTPKALKVYGIQEDDYSSEDEIFDLVHDMRTRIITSPAFDSKHIIGAILFEQTMKSKINGKFTAEYLADEKGIVPFLKIDKGLADEKNGVQLMKPIPKLADTLELAKKHKIFGTKMRSVINELNEDGIKDIVAQQFEVARQIIDAGLVPMIEPEVDIYCHKKDEIEEILNEEILKHLDTLNETDKVMLKLTVPTVANTYKEAIDHPNVVRVVALSGGYSREDANEKLKNNDGLIASFSRALSQDLNFKQSDDEFNTALESAVASIYDASVNKNN